MRLLIIIAAACVFATSPSGAQVGTTPPGATPDTLILLRAAAERGEAAAQGLLGVAYANGRWGASRDLAEAARWYRKAATLGHAPSQCLLGDMYRTGAGIAKDEAEAVTLYRASADLGFAPAQHYLGVMLATGQGVRKDLVEAVQWSRKAAEQGHPRAQYTMGQSYRKGEGVPKDEVEAARWYQKAADQGMPGAQYWLAHYYADGAGGLPLDRVHAYMWTLLAAPGITAFRSDRRDLEKLRRALEAKMSAADIAEAAQLAADWRPKAKTFNW